MVVEGVCAYGGAFVTIEERVHRAIVPVVAFGAHTRAHFQLYLMRFSRASSLRHQSILMAICVGLDWLHLTRPDAHGSTGNAQLQASKALSHP